MEKMKDYLVDFINYESYYYDCEIPITRTFFNNMILPINSKMLKNLDIATDNLVGVIAFADKKYPEYQGVYGTSINVRNRVYYTNAYKQRGDKPDKLGPDKDFDIELLEPAVVERGSIDYFGSLGKLQKALEYIFRATRFVSRMNDDNQNVDLGEKLICKVGYRVKEGKGELRLLIEKCITADENETVDIKNYKNVRIGACRKLEQLFWDQHIESIAESNSRCNITWYEPLDWKCIKEIKSFNAVQYAVYMWKGYKTSSDGNREICIYTGYVNGQGLQEALEGDARKFNDIEMESFRYTELKKSGALDSETVLRNVCEQTVVHLSAFAKMCTEISDNGRAKLNVIKSDGSSEFIVTSAEEGDIDLSEIERDHKRDDGFYQDMKNILKAAHCCKQGDGKISRKIWYESTEWVDPDDENARIVAKDTYFAVYMWIGHNEKDEHQKYLYIGIVGVDKDNAKNSNSVWNRIFMQEQKDKIRKDNNVIIDKYRYVRLIENADLLSEAALRSEILKTIEMQTINSMSALIGYANYTSVWECITPIFDDIFINEKEYRINLLNTINRYHNTRNIVKDTEN